MLSIAELWLPILVSAVFVFIASSIIHMATPMHKGDFRKMPGEDRVMAEMRAAGIQPGNYMFPCAESMKDMCMPEMTEKCKVGPVGHLIVVPNGPPSMGKNLILWFIFCLVVGELVALAAGPTLGRGAAFKSVFHVTGLAALLGYAMGAFPESIWKGQKWTVTLKFVADGIIYGVITGLTFAWLWPK
jgi:hypothetical protein